jgi:hypothetical protein
MDGWVIGWKRQVASGWSVSILRFFFLWIITGRGYVPFDESEFELSVEGHVDTWLLLLFFGVFRERIPQASWK